MVISDIVRQFPLDFTFYEVLYRDLHKAHDPSSHGLQIVNRITTVLAEIGSTKVTTSAGGHGVVGLISNGDGPTVLLRCELDDLLSQQELGLEYQSENILQDTEAITRLTTRTYGHDMHISCLLAAANLLTLARSKWKGCLVLVFQPSEDGGQGAQAMIDQKFYEQHKIPEPKIVLGQHIDHGCGGHLATWRGRAVAANAIYEVKILGRASLTTTSTDYLGFICDTTDIFSGLRNFRWHKAFSDVGALVTYHDIEDGYIRNADPVMVIFQVRILGLTTVGAIGQAAAALQRILQAECSAFGRELIPSIRLVEYDEPVVDNAGAAATIQDAFKQYFGHDHVELLRDSTMLNGLSVFAANSAPLAFWTLGSTDPDAWQNAVEENREHHLPSNRSSQFAPLVQPTLRTGAEALAIAALCFLNLQ